MLCKMYNVLLARRSVNRIHWAPNLRDRFECGRNCRYAHIRIWSQRGVRELVPVGLLVEIVVGLVLGEECASLLQWSGSVVVGLLMWWWWWCGGPRSGGSASMVVDWWATRPRSGGQQLWCVGGPVLQGGAPRLGWPWTSTVWPRLTSSILSPLVMR